MKTRSRVARAIVKTTTGIKRNCQDEGVCAFAHHRRTGDLDPRDAVDLRIRPPSQNERFGPLETLWIRGGDYSCDSVLESCLVFCLSFLLCPIALIGYLYLFF
ncbi:hypothetical protein GRJ2_001486100 [Grus japonensis]|uniref:Uncharacterized protein n=1 Tax=Grus japonensis TaxID=30415 RepID=A0ABC9WXR4_GRUJA